jgi:4-amino-4-deoxy-L-arabinose transferase-like glycosyltransferase
MVVAATAAAYAWTCASAVGWLDTPEFVAASIELGVPHSPGHPLVALLGRLFAFLPVGDLPFRIHLASAAAGAVAAWLVYELGCELGRTDSAPAAPVRLLAAAGAIAYAASAAAWGQAVRAEVYALAAALGFATLVAVLRHRRTGAPRWLLVAGLACGLNLATHHFMALEVLLPAALLVLLPRRRPAAPTCGSTALAGLLGLAALLYLPVRSAAHPVLNWGAPHELARFLWTVSARAFQGAVSSGHTSTRLEDVAQVTWALAAGAGPVLASLALVALYAGLRRPESRAIALTLAGVIALCAGGRALIGFDPETPDHHGYLLPALGLLCSLGAALPGALLQAAGPVHRRLTGALAGLLAALIAGLQWPAARDLRRYDASSDHLARWQLETLAPRTLLLLSYFQTSFRLAGLRAVEGTRPDIDLLDRSFLTYPGAAEEAALRHPALAPLIRAPLAADAPSPIAALVATAATRPVAVELHTNLDPPLHPLLLLRGPFAGLASDRPDAAARTAAETEDRRTRAELALLLERAAPAGREQLRQLLLWHDSVRMLHYCTIGQREAADRAFHAASALAPDDATLAELAAACGLTRP